MIIVEDSFNFVCIFIELLINGGSKDTESVKIIIYKTTPISVDFNPLFNILSIKWAFTYLKQHFIYKKEFTGALTFWVKTYNLIIQLYVNLLRLKFNYIGTYFSYSNKNVLYWERITMYKAIIRIKWFILLYIIVKEYFTNQLKSKTFKTTIFIYKPFV